MIAVGAVSAVAVVAVIAVLAVVFFLKPGTPAGTSVSYGSTDPVKASRITKIIPAASSDQPLTHYYARVVDAEKTDGAVDVLALPKLEVKDDQGFTMADFKQDLPAGTYTVQVTDDQGTTQNSPRLDYSPTDNTASDGSIMLTPPVRDDAVAQTNASRKGRYGAYLEKLNELQGTYGKPGIAEPSSITGYTYLTGLSFARVIDFGDGAPLLLVAYFKGGTSAQSPMLEYGLPSQTSYSIDVYQYSEASDQATLVAQDTPSFTSAGQLFFTLGTSPDSSKTYLAASDGLTYDKFYGIKEDGSFGAVSTVEYRSDGGSEDTAEAMSYTIFINGVQASDSSEVQKEEQKYTKDPQIWWLSGGKLGNKDGHGGTGSVWEYQYPDSTTNHTLEEAHDTVTTLMSQLAGTETGDGGISSSEGSAPAAKPTSDQ